ncbi:MAG: AI-2E family transporter [Actinomycetota bacterium]|nr:AI-2E family transporter [Actinomycetota bacterium]
MRPGIASGDGLTASGGRKGAAVQTDGSARSWGINAIGELLASSPLHLDQAELNRAVDQLLARFRDDAGPIARGLLSGAMVAAEVVAGLLLAIVLLFYLLKDGRRIWSWLVGLFPPRHRHDLDVIGQRAWHALGGYLKGVGIA